MTTATANPNHVNKSCSDARNAISSCPLELKNIQLIPLRYGLVERHAPEGLPMPYRLQSRPMGIRLLRDGFLYVIHTRDPKKPVLHEFKVSDGKISQLLWNSTDVSSNTRSSSVGPAKLIYKRSDTLYVAYAEVQWTARKCAQVLKSELERAHFMQCIGLSGVDCERGGNHLLTSKQAQQWLAEVAEQPAQLTAAEQRYARELTDYGWAANPEFKKIPFCQLSINVKAGYEKDHLYLLLRDDIGVMRDLAAHQDLVAGWLNDFDQDPQHERAFVVGNIIESLYKISSEQLAQAADPRLRTLIEETTTEQRQSISDYLSAKNAADNPGRQRSPSSQRVTSRRRMIAMLGEPLYERHEDLIEDMDDSIRNKLHGTKFGQRGISDLINRPAMESFLNQQRTRRNRWTARLDQIILDRTAMVASGYFFKAAWYYDPASSEQIEAALLTEYACLKDICISDASTETLARYLDEHPEAVLPVTYTIPLTAKAEFEAKVASIIKAMRNTQTAPQDWAKLQSRIKTLNELMTEKLPAAQKIGLNGETFHQTVNTIYQPAIQLRLAKDLDDALTALTKGLPADPAAMLRQTPGAFWLQTLRAFDQEGVTLSFASTAQIERFRYDVEDVIRLRQERITLKLQIDALSKSERRKHQARAAVTAKREQLIMQRRQLAAEISVRENRIAPAMSPFATGPAQYGFQLTGLAADQVDEIQKMANDARARLPMQPVTLKLFKSGAPFSFAAAYFQTANFLAIYQEIRTSESMSGEDWFRVSKSFFAMSNSTLSAFQGAAMTSIYTIMDSYQSAARKYQYAAHLGRCTAILGAGAYAFGVFSNAFKFADNSNKLWHGLRSGEPGKIAGAAIAVVGDGGQVVLNYRALTRTGKIFSQIKMLAPAARQLAWAMASERLISIAGRTNLYGLVLTVVQLIGEFIYNHYDLAELDKWLLHGPWGKEMQQRELAEDQVWLDKIVTRPTATLGPQGVINLQGQPYNPDSAYLRLRIPALTAATLGEVELQLCAYRLLHHRRNDWEPYSEALLSQLRITSTPDGPLDLQLEIFGAERNAHNGFAIGLRYYSSADALECEEYYFQTIGLAAHQLTELQPVTLLKTRQHNARWLMVSDDDLYQPDQY